MVMSFQLARWSCAVMCSSWVCEISLTEPGPWTARMSGPRPQSLRVQGQTSIRMLFGFCGQQLWRQLYPSEKSPRIGGHSNVCSKVFWFIAAQTLSTDAFPWQLHKLRWLNEAWHPWRGRGPTKNFRSWGISSILIFSPGIRLAVTLSNLGLPCHPLK